MANLTAKEKAGCFVGILALIPMSLGYVMTYLVLTHINASDSMWLLFWIYAPLGIIVSILFKLIENAIKE
jgi:uncharacterized membrane protein